MPRARHTDTTFSWVEGPMQLISTPNGTSDQSIIHNCIIRALNSIYIQAPHVPMSEYNSFIAYCLATYQGLDAYLKTVDVTRDQVEQAKSKGWGHWLQSIARKRNNFNPDICRGMMDDFMPSHAIFFGTLTTSFTNIATFLAGLDNSAQLAVFLLNHDSSFNGGGEDFPKGGWWTQKVAVRKNRAWWTFATVGVDGAAKEVGYL